MQRRDLAQEIIDTINQMKDNEIQTVEVITFSILRDVDRFVQHVIGADEAAEERAEPQPDTARSATRVTSSEHRNQLRAEQRARAEGGRRIVGLEPSRPRRRVLG